MRRAEVWWADLPQPYGRRPVVVLTRDPIAGTIGSVIVCIVTRTIRGLPTEVRLGRAEGLPAPCVANLDNILTVPRSRMVEHAGALPAEKLEPLNSALRHALGL